MNNVSRSTLNLLPKINYSGMLEEEAHDLVYLLKNCFSLSEGELLEINLCYDNGLLSIQGIIKDRAFIVFNCTGLYDGSSLTIISNIKEGSGINNIRNNDCESYSTTDTFYFEADNIKVVSINPAFKAPEVRMIDYISAHRKI